MSFTAEALYQLLPAIYRIRDAEQGKPLEELLRVIAEQAAVVEENLELLYDDQFIETCAEWAAPYIGDLIGYRALHGVAPRISSPRADVANTIARRRRKGTAAMLEQLAWDVTGWRARVVEFFQLLGTTQYMNHVRPDNRLTPDLRDWESLERLGSPFESVAHTLDVRRIASGRGRYNIPNIGIFLWRLPAFPVTQSPATPVEEASMHRYRFNPLGIDAPLLTRPEPEDLITHLAEPVNVPAPIRRRVLHERRGNYYGSGKSLSIWINDSDTAWPPDAIDICDLSGNDSAGWAHEALPGRISIDPVLGRIAFPPSEPAPEQVRVSFHYGFSDAMGGGEYERAQAAPATFTVCQSPCLPPLAPQDAAPTHTSIRTALQDLPAEGGIVEIIDNGRYVETETLTIEAQPGHSAASVELRARTGRRPTIVLSGGLEIRGGPGSTVTLSGLLLAATAQPVATPSALVRVPNANDNTLRTLRVRHCTLVPGQALHPDGEPRRPGAPTLEVAIAGTTVEIERSIVGGLRIQPGSAAIIEGSIVDATEPSLIAYSGPGINSAGDGPGGALTLDDCTVVGRVFSEVLERVSNSILHARLPDDDADDPWPAPVWAERRQEGCLRFSFVPLGSLVPRRFRCQPDLAITAEIEKARQEAGGEIDPSARAAIVSRVTAEVVSHFTSDRYGHPGYAQLRQSCPLAIRTGAEDEAEMGAFRELYQHQREINLRVRLQEYLRFGLEAGIFYET